MQALIRDFGRFIAGQLSGDELRSACERFVRSNPNQRAEAALWFEEGVKSGRVSAACWESIADAFKPAPAPNDAESLFAVGSVIKGRYRLIEELSRGPTGQVFKAQDEDLQRARSTERFIALKAFRPQGGVGAAARAGLQTAFDAAKSLTHEHIVRLYDLDWDGATAFVTQEYLEGSPLSALLRSDYARGTELARAWPTIAAAGGALAYAHEKGVIHSRLEPGTAFITRGGALKLLDFVGRSAPAAGGATPYASLEQCAGQAATAQDDVYAFAVLIYEMLSGHHPFANVPALAACEAGLVPKRVDGLRRRSWEALRGALAFRREARTRNMTQLLQALEPVSFIRKYRLPLAGGALIAITAGIALGSHEYADYLERETLRAAAHAPARAAARGPLTPERRKELEDSLFLAEDYLRDVNLSQAPDDLAYALSEGANNVNQILDSVLAVDAGNSQALKMKARVADLYLQKARDLSGQHQLPAALAIAQYGLKVMPDNLDLFHLQREICGKQPPLCAAN